MILGIAIAVPLRVCANSVIVCELEEEEEDGDELSVDDDGDDAAEVCR